MNKEIFIKRAVISVTDISCSNCAFNIENVLKKINGVESVNVQVVTKMVIVRYYMDKVDIKDIIEGIKSVGYNPDSVYESEVGVIKQSIEHLRNEKRKLFIKFVISVIISIILFIFKNTPDYLSFIFSFFVWFYCASHFHKGFWHAVKNKTSDMNTLVSLSSTVMLLYISYAVFFRNHEHFFHWHEISMLIAFINLGRYFESKIRCDVSKGIEKINFLFPKTATKINDDDSVSEIKVSEIKKGDIILLKPGSEAPVDGEIVEGWSYFDLRHITGESISVIKKVGDFIYSGSINQSGAVKIKSINVGDETMIAKILKAITDAQNIKLNIQKKVDKISKYFVPLVIIIALVSSAIWFFYDRNMGVNVFASVLAISCPCAIGLSVPIAVMIGLSRTIKLGFVINNPSVIENFSNVDTVILDKTGTLTEGKMNVYKIKSNIDEIEFVKLLYSAEFNSEHIFSDAVKRYAEPKDIKPYKIFDFRAYPGKGIECKTEKGMIFAGSAEFFKEKSINFIKDDKEIKNIELPFMLLSLNYNYLGYVVFYDPLRGNAKEIVKRFKEYGILPVVASGDIKNSVKKVADELGIEEYYYEVKPDEKQGIVLKYKLLGKRVVMIGDGINDSAAINESDIGIAMGSAKEMTIYSSDMALMSNDISVVFKIIKLVNSIKRIINQNLFWAFSYNIVLIPIASGILYPINGVFIKPYMAAIAMGISSILVVLNSMRLLKLKI